MGLIISVEEARSILGAVSDSMIDDEITQTIETLDVMANDALQTARKNLSTSDKYWNTKDEL